MEEFFVGVMVAIFISWLFWSNVIENNYTKNTTLAKERLGFYDEINGKFYLKKARISSGGILILDETQQKQKEE